MNAVIPAWHLRAACQYTDPEAFFPDDGDTDVADEARGVCIGCPVRAECLRHALSAGEQWGVWGGLTERQLLRERQHRPPRPVTEVFAAADSGWRRRRTHRLALWEHAATVAATFRKADETEELAA